MNFSKFRRFEQLKASVKDVYSKDFLKLAFEKGLTEWDVEDILNNYSKYKHKYSKRMQKTDNIFLTFFNTIKLIVYNIVYAVVFILYLLYLIVAKTVSGLCSVQV